MSEAVLFESISNNFGMQTSGVLTLSSAKTIFSPILYFDIKMEAWLGNIIVLFRSCSLPFKNVLLSLGCSCS